MRCVSDGVANRGEGKTPFYEDSDSGLSPSVIRS